MDEAKGVVFGWFRHEQEIEGEKVECYFNVTVRSEESVEDAIDKFFDGIVHAKTQYNASPYKPINKYGGVPAESVSPEETPPESNEITYVPIDDDGNELAEHRINYYAHHISQKGKSYLKVYGSWFEKYGLPVWDSMIPDVTVVLKNGDKMKLKEAYKSLPVGEKVDVPKQMRIALVRGRGKDAAVKGFKEG